MRSGTQLGQVRGLGSARSGTHHWVVQRITAVANLILLTWLGVSLILHRFPTVDALREWLASPAAAIPMVLLVISVFTHLKLGLQVLIEDYVHSKPLKIAALLKLNFFAFGGAAAAIYAIAAIAFGAPNAG